jgi:predicted transcriptional regulator of viral defense system
VKKRRLGDRERQLLAYAQMRGVRTLGTGDLVGPLGLTAKQERELFSRMARSGLIAKARRGLYLVPSRLPLAARWTPDAALVLDTLVAGSGGRYQVCGPNAFNRYGFSEQVPQLTFAYNNRLSGRRTVGVVRLVLIKVADDRLGDTETRSSSEGGDLVYSSRVCTLLDAVYDWPRFNTLPRAYGWIRSDLEAGRVTPAELVRVTLRYGNARTIRRVGALLDGDGASRRLLDELAEGFPSPRTVIPLVPGAPKIGRILRRWGVQLNARP